MSINRLTAHKVWISDLINSPYIKMSGEFESNYIEIKDKQVSRVNIIATIINKIESADKNYVSLVLDDGTEQIRIKTWGQDIKLTNKFDVGNAILIIGRIKIYNEEIYLLPEIVKKVNINWEIARKFELLKLYGRPMEHKFSQDIIKEEKPMIEEIRFDSSNLRNELLNLIEKYEEKGISLEEIKIELHASLEEINKILEELIKEGQIYMVGNKYRLTT